MERTWMETVQLLGLDLMVASILLMLLGAGLAALVRAGIAHLRQRARGRLGAAPTRPLDAWPSQEWGPSH